MFFGWKVVGVAFTVAFFGFGLGFYSLSLYLPVLHQRHGWPIGLISSAITGYYVLGAILVVFLGDAFDQFGSRNIVLLAMAALASGVLAIAHLSDLWQLYAAFAVMAFGWAGMGGGAIALIVAPWFDTRRGLAVSLALNGASCGGAVIVPLWTALIGIGGFPSAALVLVTVMCVTLIPLSAIYLHRGPAHLGLMPDGIAETDAVAPSEKAHARRSPARRSDLVRSLRFWTVSAPLALALFAQVGFLTHQVAYLMPQIGIRGAALALSLTTVAAMIGRIAMGLVIDRIDRRTAATGTMLMQAAAIAFLISSSSPGVLYGGCVIFGLGVGNVVSFPALIVQTEYPNAHFNRVVSLIVAINQFTFAFGPGVLGWLRDWSGSYPPVFTLCIACEILAAIVIQIRLRPAQSSGTPA